MVFVFRPPWLDEPESDEQKAAGAREYAIDFLLRHASARRQNRDNVRTVTDTEREKAAELVDSGVSPDERDTQFEKFLDAQWDAVIRARAAKRDEQRRHDRSVGESPPVYCQGSTVR